MFKIAVSIALGLHLVALHTSMAGMEIFSSILILLALILVVTKRLPSQTSAQWPILIFVGVLLLNLLVTPAEMPWLERVRDWRWIFVYWGLAHTLQWVWSSKFERFFLKIWFYSLGAVTIYGVFQFFTGVDLMRDTSEHMTIWGGVFRATGFFSVSLTYAYAIGLLGLSAIGASAQLGRWVPLMFSFASVIVVLVSMARGAWIALAASTLLGLLWLRKKYSWQKLLGFSLLCALPLALLLSNVGSRERLYNTATMKTDDSASIRKDLWRGYLQIFKEHPWFGVGYGQGKAHLPEAYRTLNITQDFVSHAHNDYIQTLAEMGIFGLLAFLLLIIWMMKKTFDLKDFRPDWALSLFAAQVFLFLGCFTQANFTDAEVNHALMLNWALMASLSHLSLKVPGQKLRNFLRTKRIFDLLLSALLLPVLLPLFLITAAAVRLTSRGGAIHWSKRIGAGNQIFLMPKFRTMKIDTPQVATDLLTDPKKYLTSIGHFLRKSSLDELPQIYSVLRGDMSFVGPRPALFNQDDLVKQRTELGIESLHPGITGWAQVNGRDELPLSEKVALDQAYLKDMSIWFDLKIMLLTVLKVFRAEGVSH